MHSETKTKYNENEELSQKVKHLEEALSALTLTVSKLNCQAMDIREERTSISNSDLDSESEEYIENENIVEDCEVENTEKAYENHTHEDNVTTRL